MKPFHSTVVGRLLAAAGLCAAFIVMASIFVPHPIEARDDSSARPSSDPHEGLRLIGTLEHAGHVVRVYSTQHGPRYSVYAVEGEALRQLGVLLSEEQMQRHHPKLSIKDARFDGRQIMLAPTDREF